MIRWLILVWAIAISACNGGVQKQDSITIATSANMQFAMKAIANNFTNSTGLKTNVILGSSGKLTAQIIEGAPYDIFVSADLKYPEMIQEQGFSDSAPEIYALGQLVLWSSTLDTIPSLDQIATMEIEHIAIANPVTAPYGQAAIEVLQNLGVYSRIKDKLVFGESIAQTNQFISSGAAEIGFTAKSVVLSPEINIEGHWLTIPPEYYKPIAQGAIIIERNQSNKKEIKSFYDYLFNQEAKQILKDFGYLVNE